MAGEFYYPFKGFVDPLSHAKNQTALEEFLNASQVFQNDIVSAVWDGAYPADLSSGPDPNATAGFYIDTDAGAAQFEGNLYITLARFHNPTNDASLSIQSFVGSGRHVGRIFADSEGNGPYLQFLADTDTSGATAAGLQARDSDDQPVFNINASKPSGGKNYLSAQETSMTAHKEIFPYGTMLSQVSSNPPFGYVKDDTTAVTTSDTTIDSKTINLEYSGQKVIVEVIATVTALDLDENEDFDAWIKLNSSAASFLSSKHSAGLGSITQPSHTHLDGSYQVSGTPVTGTSDVSSTDVVSIADAPMSVTVHLIYEFDPGATTSFTIELHGQVTSTGAPASWRSSMSYKVSRAGIV